MMNIRHVESTGVRRWHVVDVGQGVGRNIQESRAAQRSSNFKQHATIERLAQKIRKSGVNQAARLKQLEKIAGNLRLSQRGRQASNFGRYVEAETLALYGNGKLSVKRDFTVGSFLGRRTYRLNNLIEGGQPSVLHEKLHPAIRDKILNKGFTNKILMEMGNAPVGPDGLQINLHHVIGQEPGSMIELPQSLHQRLNGPLHNLIIDGRSFRNNPQLLASYESFRKAYWKARAADF